MTDKEKIITDLKQALDKLDVTSNLRLVLINTIEYLQKESISEDFEEALANEWKAYNDRGAATVDALEDNTQELAFAKGFYRGSNWKGQQMIANAIDGKVIANGMGSPILHLWDKGRHFIDKKVKVILVKED